MMVARSAVRRDLRRWSTSLAGDVGARRGQGAQRLDRHRVAGHGQAAAPSPGGAVLDQPHPSDPGRRGQRLGGGLQVGRGLRDQRPGAGVGQDPFDLLGRRGLVDRHRGRARGPDGVVDDRPLVPGPRHQRDPVSRGDPRGDEPLGQRRHVVGELPGGDVLPAGVSRGALAPHDHAARFARGPLEHDIGQARRRRYVHGGGGAVLSHPARLIRAGRPAQRWPAADPGAAGARPYRGRPVASSLWSCGCT